MSDTLNLGQIITTPQNRDAIHIAVVPVRANEPLRPGQHVGLTQGGDAAAFNTTIGVVDPYLDRTVDAGQMFWLFLYPGSITSLRHEWTHPAFPVEVAAEPVSDKESSRVWLEEFAGRLFSYSAKHPRYQDMGPTLEALVGGIESGGFFGEDIEYGDGLQPSAELYRHYEIYTGKQAPARPGHFRCAC